MRVAVDGGEIAVTTSGIDAAATPVVLLHGLNCAGSVWTGVVAELTDRPTAAVDLRGHGASTRSGPFGSAQQVVDLDAVLGVLGWSRVHLVGSSFGGAVALEFAAARPDRTASAALFGTALDADLDLLGQALGLLHAVGVDDFFREIGPELSFGPDADPAWIAEADRIAKDNTPEVVAALLEAAFSESYRSAAARVRCPVLVARGEHDLTCGAEDAQATAAALGTAVHEIPGAGHMPMVEAPAATAKLITAHLSGCDG